MTSSVSWSARPRPVSFAGSDQVGYGGGPPVVEHAHALAVGSYAQTPEDACVVTQSLSSRHLSAVVWQKYPAEKKLFVNSCDGEQ